MAMALGRYAVIGCNAAGRRTGMDIGVAVAGDAGRLFTVDEQALSGSSSLAVRGAEFIMAAKRIAASR